MTDDNAPAKKDPQPTELSPEWCKVSKHTISTEFLCYPEDGECECGVHKHHVHCMHGAIIQIG